MRSAFSESFTKGGLVGVCADDGWSQTSVICRHMRKGLALAAVSVVVVFAVLILTLVFRPEGLLGERLADWKKV